MKCPIMPWPGRRLCFAVFVFIGGLHAQDFANIQIHGFATQGILYSTHNNYLTADTNSGSLQWTHGAVSVIDTPSDNLRIGMQLHMYQLGQLGGPNLQIDWASGDYRVNDHFGVRAGKVKTVLGLYNDSQDVDASFLWCLLPQGTYPADNESFFLSHLGGDAYGEFSLGNRGGRLDYDGYVGHLNVDLTEGFVKKFSDAGFIFTSAPGGKTYGGDLRWHSFIRGLVLGSSINVEAIDGANALASLHIPTFNTIVGYGQFNRGRWGFAGQYGHNRFTDVLTSPVVQLVMPYELHPWFVMASYRVSEKVQLGSYYSQSVNAAANTSLPQNYSKDFVISTRYDFNSYFYAKVEDHFLHGTALGYYSSTNPNGLQPNSNILAAKIGFTF